MKKGKRNLLTLLIAASGVALTTSMGNAAQNESTIDARIEKAQQQLMVAAKNNNSEQIQDKYQISQWMNWDNWRNR